MALTAEKLLVAIGSDTRGLKRGSKTTRKSLGKIERSVGKLEKGARRLQAVFAGALGGAALINTAERLFSAFAEQERAVTELRTALVATGKDGTASLRAITEEATRLQRATIAGDEALIQASATLAQLAPSLDVAELARAQSIIVAIADTFLKGDIQQSALLLGKTLGSTTNALSRYGLTIQDTAAPASEKLAQLVGSKTLAAAFEVSQAKAKTLFGRAQQLKNAFGDLQEVLAGVLVEAGSLTGRTGDLTGRIHETIEAIRESKAEWVAWAKVGIESVKFVISIFKNLVRVAFNVGQIIGRSLEIGISQLLGDVMNLLNVAINEPINALIRQMNRLPGVDIDFRIAELPAQQFFDNAREQARNLQGDIRDLGSAVTDVAGSWTAVREAALQAEFAQETAAAAAREGAGAAGAAGGGGAGGMDLEVRTELATSGLHQIRLLDETLDRVKESGTSAFEAIDSSALELARSIAGPLSEALEDMTGGVGAVTGSFGQLYDSIVRVLNAFGIDEPGGTGFEGFVKALAGVAAGIAQIAGGGGIFGGGRAHGGPVSGRRSYLVGERGPELFVPGVSGEVVPLGGSAAAAGPANVTVRPELRMDLSRLPRPSDPRQAARDSDWLRFMSETMKEWEHNGGRLTR